MRPMDELTLLKDFLNKYKLYIGDLGCEIAKRWATQRINQLEGKPYKVFKAKKK